MHRNCLEGVWQVSGGFLNCVWRVSQRCLEGIYGMSEWYVRCLDASEVQVRTSQVRIGKATTGQVRTGQDRCLAGVLRVSVGYIMDVRMVCEVSRCI